MHRYQADIRKFQADVLLGVTKEKKMKKVMMMFAVVALVASVQAASVTWSLGAGTLYDYKDTKQGSGVTCYLVLDSYVSTIDAKINNDKNFTAIKTSTALGIVDTGVTTGSTGLMSTRTVNGTLASYMTTPGGSTAIANGDSVAYRVLFVDTANGAWKYSDAISVKAYDENASTVIKTTAQFKSGQFGVGAAHGTAWQTVTSAPEPTSGLLVLVGLGLLGLRRRRA